MRAGAAFLFSTKKYRKGEKSSCGFFLTSAPSVFYNADKGKGAGPEGPGAFFLPCTGLVHSGRGQNAGARKDQ